MFTTHTTNSFHVWLSDGIIIIIIHSLIFTLYGPHYCCILFLMKMYQTFWCFSKSAVGRFVFNMYKLSHPRLLHGLVTTNYKPLSSLCWRVAADPVFLFSRGRQESICQYQSHQRRLATSASPPPRLKELKDMPQPRGSLPLLGATLQMLKHVDTTHELLEEWAKGVDQLRVSRPRLCLQIWKLMWKSGHPFLQQPISR